LFNGDWAALLLVERIVQGERRVERLSFTTRIAGGERFEGNLQQRSANMPGDAIHFLSPKELVIRPQVRKRQKEDADNALMQSLREEGMLQPIRARLEDGKPIVVVGHRRAAMAARLGMEKVPVIFDDRQLGLVETLVAQLAENLAREDLSPLEKASGVRQLMDATGWTCARVAGKIGLSPASVSKLLPLLSLPQPIINLIEAGKITASAGYELGRIEDPDKQAELAAQLVDGRLTRDALVGTVKAGKKRPAKRNGNQPTRVTAILGEGRSVTVATAALTLERFIEVIEELLAKARRVRTQGVELATFIKMLKDQARAG
jgi:ParB family chromosome partitioning protein